MLLQSLADAYPYVAGQITASVEIFELLTDFSTYKEGNKIRWGSLDHIKTCPLDAIYLRSGKKESNSLLTDFSKTWYNAYIDSTFIPSWGSSLVTDSLRMRLNPGAMAQIGLWLNFTDHIAKIRGSRKDHADFAAHAEALHTKEGKKLITTLDVDSDVGILISIGTTNVGHILVGINPTFKGTLPTTLPIDMPATLALNDWFLKNKEEFSPQFLIDNGQAKTSWPAKDHDSRLGNPGKISEVLYTAAALDKVSLRLSSNPGPDGQAKLWVFPNPNLPYTSLLDLHQLWESKSDATPAKAFEKEGEVDSAKATVHMIAEMNKDKNLTLLQVFPDISISHLHHLEHLKRTGLPFNLQRLSTAVIRPGLGVDNSITSTHKLVTEYWTQAIMGLPIPMTFGYSTLLQAIQASSTAILQSTSSPLKPWKAIIQGLAYYNTHLHNLSTLMPETTPTPLAALPAFNLSKVKYLYETHALGIPERSRYNFHLGLAMGVTLNSLRYALKDSRRYEPNQGRPLDKLRGSALLSSVTHGVSLLSNIDPGTTAYGAASICAATLNQSTTDEYNLGLILGLTTYVDLTLLDKPNL